MLEFNGPPDLAFHYLVVNVPNIIKKNSHQSQVIKIVLKQPNEHVPPDMLFVCGQKLTICIN